MAGFFFRGLAFGTSEESFDAEAWFELADAFCLLRLLNEVMNSSAWGLSPRKFCRWSAASLSDKVSVYEMTCLRESSSSGRTLESCGNAQVARSILATEFVGVEVVLGWFAVNH